MDPVTELETFGVGRPLPASMRTLTQSAPWPVELEEIVAGLTYKRGYDVVLEDVLRDEGRSRGLTLIIRATNPNSYAPDEQRRVAHFFAVPPSTYDRRAWQRWVLDRLLDVEAHEVCEFFQVDGERPYAPDHGHGRDPYVIVERGTWDDAARKAGK
jgi:hypothetical protein